MSAVREISAEILIRAIDHTAAELSLGRITSHKALHRALAWGNGFRRRYRLLYVAQRGRCCICRELIVPGPFGVEEKSPSVEHVVPQSRGGGRLQNLLLSHLQCNQRRRDAEPSPELLALAATVHALLARWAAQIPNGSFKDTVKWVWAAAADVEVNAIAAAGGAKPW